MKRWIAAGILILALTGCSRYEPAKEITRSQKEAARPEEAEAQSGPTPLRCREAENGLKGRA